MKIISLAAILLSLSLVSAAQRPSPRSARTRSAEIGQQAVVIDETLSVLREKPSLFANSIQRMQRGRKVQILGVTEADGVRFYKVTAPPKNFGWVQADAVFGKFRPTDEERLARLVRAYNGFDQIEIALQFFTIYPDSKFRPPLLLLFGDIVEDAAAKITKSANSLLKNSELAASGAPVYSHFLNFNQLDRYRRLGIVFVFNAATRQFHYNGASWSEITTNFPAAAEAVEAKKRIDSLKAKMAAQTTK